MISSVLKIIFVVIPAAVISLIVALLAAQYRFSHRMRLYRLLGRRYSGEVGNRWLTPQLMLTHAARPCVLREMWSGWGGGRAATLVETRIPGEKWELIISDRAAASPVGEMSRLKELETGDPVFNQAFSVRTSEQRLAVKVVGEGLRWHLREMKSRFGKRSLTVSLRREVLRVAIDGRLATERDLSDFLRLALRAVDQVLLIEASGIEFRNTGEATVVDSVHCPVCSGRLSERIVICVSCKTPHCQECWEYNGRCAMFACNETRSQRV